MNAAVGRDLELAAEDGRRLAATLYTAAQPNGLCVLINSATATPRQYYRAFATFLASRGFVVLTYDYRGFGGSLHGPLRREKVRLLDWGQLDQAAGAAFLRNHFPDRALVVVGHSVGGQLLGLSRHAGEVRAALLVGSAHGYWRKWPNRGERYRKWFTWQVVARLLIPLFGYLPGWIRGRKDVPGGVARDTMRFTLSPHFFCDEAGNPLRPFNGDIRGPVRLLTLSDDSVAPPAATLDLASYYPNAIHRVDHLTPAHYGVAAVGHFGFFRRSMPQSAWIDAADWLAAHATP